MVTKALTLLMWLGGGDDEVTGMILWAQGRSCSSHFIALKTIQVMSNK